MRIWNALCDFWDAMRGRDAYSKPPAHHVCVQWEVIGVQPSMRVPLQPSSTVILYKCTGCSKVMAETISGSWTRQEVENFHRLEPDVSITDEDIAGI